MAFFKFRKGGDDHPAPTPALESVEALRKRARHRLIGAAILVLVGVVGFPMLFDNQPRPVAVDIPIEIPDKAKVRPMTAGQEAMPKTTASVASAPKEEVVIPTAVAGNAVTAVAPSSALASAPGVAQVVSKPVEKSSDKVPVKVEGTAKAQASPDGKAVAPASGTRFIVQVGAFAEVLKAREARARLEKAGLKTYTQVVQSPEGKRIRVRVGPFDSHADADKAATRIKKLDLPAAILEL